MEPKQLRALLAIDEHHSFSGAARALNTVQSNVSTHISRLERELDVVLVDRATCQLTYEGGIVAARARRIELEFHALESDIAALRGAVRGTVKLGVIGTTARWLVPALLESLGKTFPEVRLVILDATTSSLVPQVATGSLDLAVINAPIRDPELKVDQLFDEDRVLVVCQDHPLYERDGITLRDLARYELLLPNVGTSFRNELDDDLARVGLKLRPQAEIDGMRLLASLAFSGFGAAVLPASAAPPWISGNWKKIAIEGLSRRTVATCRRKRSLPSPAQGAVTAEIQRLAREEAAKNPGIVLPPPAQSR